MKKHITELLGSFFLTLTLIMTTHNGYAAVAPLAVGFVFAGMIFTGGGLSAGYFNPAVSLAMWIRGRIHATDFASFFVVQTVGALLASAIAVMLLRCSHAADIVLHKNELICTLIAEFFGVFALVWVILNVTRHDERGQINAFAPVAVGFIFTGILFAVSSVSGGACNPAVAIGMCLSGMIAWHDLWLYFVAAGFAAAGAASLFQVFFGVED